MITRVVDLKGKFIRNVIEFQIRYKQGQDYIKNVFKVSSIFQITGLHLEATPTSGTFCTATSPPSDQVFRAGDGLFGRPARRVVWRVRRGLRQDLFPLNYFLINPNSLSARSKPSPFSISCCSKAESLSFDEL